MATVPSKPTIKTPVRLLWRVVFGGIILFLLLILLADWGVFGYMPSLEELENPSADLASVVYAEDGTPIGKYYYEDRTTCKFSEISPYVINGLVATEDHRFYENSGIDPIGTLAIPYYLLTGRKRGSSTIAQQLALNLFGERAKNPVFRALQKLKEWVLAVKLERRFTKDEILALYLNTVPFGDNLYGIKNASLTFFGKNPNQLNVQEAATLIGMLRGSTLYNPRRNPRMSLERRNTVINNMEDNGYLTGDQAAAAKSTPIQLHYRKLDHNDGIAPYFIANLKESLLKPWCASHKKPDGTPYDLYRDGLRVYTTINPVMQTYADNAVGKQMAVLQKEFDAQSYIKSGKNWKGHENILNNYITSSDRYRAMKDDDMSDEDIKKFFYTQKVPMKVFAWDRYTDGLRNTKDTVMTPLDSIKYMQQMLQAGFMVMDPESGEVKAWVGGNEFRYFKYDHVNINTKRQVGSTIKPLLYTYAIMNGFSPSTEVPNDPVYFPAYHWTSKNAEGGTGGMVTLSQALAQSLNNVSAYLIQKIGPQQLVDFAKKCGVTSPLQPYPSLSLGAANISLYEMVQAYSMFPNKGVMSKPVYITRIEDRNGNILESFAPARHEVINERLAYTMVQMMEGVVNGGTGSRLRFRFGLSGEMAGKTGTTNDYVDGWYIGYTPQLLAGAWVGNDNEFLHFNSMALGQGANMALPIWGYFFQQVYKDKSLGISQNAHFEAPANMINNVGMGAYDPNVPAGAESQDVGNGSASDYLDADTSRRK